MAKMLKQLDLKYAWMQLLAGPLGPPNPMTRLVLLVLALHMKKDGADCFPGAQHIAMRSSLSERAVRKHIKLAVASGWLSVKSRSGLVNLYCPTIPEAARATIGRKPGAKMKPWLLKALLDDVTTPAHAAGVAVSKTPAPDAGVAQPAQSAPRTPAHCALDPGTAVNEPLHEVHANFLGNYKTNNPRPDSPPKRLAGTVFAKVEKDRKPERDSEEMRKDRIKKLLTLPGFTDDASIARVAHVTVDEVRQMRTLQ